MTTKLAFNQIEGMKINVLDAGVDNTGVIDATTIVNTLSEEYVGYELYFPPGTYKGNFVIGNNNTIKGAGRNATTFISNTSSGTILTLGDATALNQWYISASDFTIDGEDNPNITGYRVGTSGGTLQAHYGSTKNLEVKNCYDNIHLDTTIGFSFENVYSWGAENAALEITHNDIVTTGLFKSCQFRQSKIGLNLRGGSLLEFNTCIVESNLDVGLIFQRVVLSGQRQARFINTWFENNGHTPTTPLAGNIYLDINASLAASEVPTYLQFENCVFSVSITSDPNLPDVQLNRGNQIEFKKCSFRGLDSTRLVANTGTGFTYAKLIDCCGSVSADVSPSPAHYVNFPARVASGNKLLGFTYEYEYQGKKYNNYTPTKVTVTSNVFDLDVTGIDVLACDTAGGSFEVQSFTGGYEGQVITLTKPFSTSLTLKQNFATGDEPLLTSTSADISMTTERSVQFIFEQGKWYQIGL